MEKKTRLKKKEKKINNIESYERKFMLLILKELVRKDEILGELCKNKRGKNANIIK